MDDSQPDTWYLFQSEDGPLIVKLFSGGTLTVLLNNQEICNEWINQEAKISIGDKTYTLKRLLNFDGKEHAELYLNDERQQMLEMSMSTPEESQPLRRLFIISVWIVVALVVLMFILRFFSGDAIK